MSEERGSDWCPPEEVNEADISLRLLAKKTTRDIESLLNSIGDKCMTDKQIKEFCRLIRLINSIGYIAPVGK